LCREHGRQLTDLANNDNDHSELMKGFKMFGVVKEIGVDDEGLSVFHRDHFTYPLYKDDGLVFYNDFFGKRSILKLSSLNPFMLYRMTTRLGGKILEGNVTGEGLVQGGIVIFDQNGKARYAYEEETGKELVMDDIIQSLKNLQIEG